MSRIKRIMAMAILMMWWGCQPALSREPVLKYKQPEDFAVSATLQTSAHQISYATADTDFNDLAETTKTWSDCEDTFVVIPLGWNAGSIMGYAFGDGTGQGDPCDGSGGISIYICDWLGGAKTAWTGTYAVGAVQLSHNPCTGTTDPPYTDANDFAGVADANYAWIDTITEVADVWKKNITVSGGAGSETGGNIASIEIDFFGAYLIFVKTTSLTDATAVVWIMKPNY